VRRRSVILASLVAGGLVVGFGGAPVLAADAAPAASAAPAPVRGAWLPAQELPGTSLASDAATNLDLVACAPGAECVTADDTLKFKTNADVPFLVSEKTAHWAKAQQIPGLAALAGKADNAAIHGLACPASGYCVAVGFYGSPATHAFVSQETKGAWGKPVQIPGLAALDTVGLGSADLVSCPSVGNCTVAGSYGNGSKDSPVLREYVASEAGGHWHDAIPVPGLDALADVADGGEAGVASLSCASAGDCALGGSYFVPPSPSGPGVRGLRHDAASARPATQFRQFARLGPATTAQATSVPEGAFVAAEVGGTWGDATTPAIPGLTSTGEAEVSSVACPAAGDCIAAGAYSDSASSNAGGGFYLTQNGTGWSTPTTSSTFAAESLVCPSVGNCTAAGGDVNNIAAAQREEGGVWGPPAELPGARGLAYKGKKASESAVLSLACPSAGNCSAAGLYATGSATNPTAVLNFLASDVNGTWQAVQVPPGLAALGTSGFGLFGNLACASPANCLTGGSYDVSGAHGGAGAFELTELPARSTGTLIGLSAGTVVYGKEQAGRVSVKVTAGLGFPPGRVVVWAGPKAVCAIALKSGQGSCLLTAKELGTGTYHLVARYSATAPYLQSTSAPKTLVVKK